MLITTVTTTRINILRSEFNFLILPYFTILPTLYRPNLKEYFNTADYKTTLQATCKFSKIKITNAV